MTALRQLGESPDDASFWPEGMEEAEKETVSFYEKLRRAGEEASRRRVGDAELNLAFLSGNQWMRYEYPSGLMEVDNAVDEERVTDNRILPSYLRWMADLFATDPAVDVYEGGIELSDAEAAKAATLLCDYWKRNNGWQQARMEQAAWMLVGSVGYVAPVWDEFRFAPKRRRRVTRLLKSSTTSARRRKTFLQTEDRMETRGDLAFRVFHPLQTYLFPLDAARWGNVTRIMVVSVESCDWLDEQRGERPREDFRALGTETVWQEAIDRVNRFVSPDFGLESKPTMGPRYLTMRVWENPTKDHPKGRYLEIVGNRVLHDDALPYIEEAQDVDPLNADNLWMGVVPQFAGIFPGKLYPSSPVTTAREGQKQINEIATDAMQNRRAMRNNKLIVEEGQLKRESWSDEAAEIVEIKPGGTVQPHFMQAPALSGLDSDRSAAEYSYTEMTGQTEASRGVNPTYVRSAEHYSMAESQSQKVIHMMGQQAEWSFEKQARLAMAIAKRRYSLEDLIRIVGQNRAIYAAAFGTSCIRTDLAVKQGSGLSRNHVIRQQAIDRAFQYGVFDPAKVSPEARRLYLAQNELGVTQSLADEDMQRQKQETENIRMALYLEPAMVDESDDHDVHIAAVRRYMARPSFWRTGRTHESIKALFQVHLDDHLSARADQLVPEQTVDMEPIAGLGRVPGNEQQPQGVVQ